MQADPCHAPVLPAARAAASPIGADTVWHVPGLRVEAAHRWPQVAVSVFARGSGEASWRSGWHRLALAETDFPHAAIRVEGGPQHEGPLRPGNMVLHPAGVTTLSRHGAGRYVQVLLDPALLASAALEVAGGRPLALELGPAFRDPLCAEILRALAREVNASPGARLLVDGLATALAVHVVRRLGPAPAPAAAWTTALGRDRLRRVLDHIEANLGEDLSLADLAAVACLSPWHFSRCFAGAMGMGPHRYVRQRRVARAQEALRRPEAPPLAALAHALGFADQSHFTRAFRRETGETPGRWRAAVLAA